MPNVLRALTRWLIASRQRSELLDVYKDPVRSIPAALCSSLVILVLGFGLYSSAWFYLHGGGCNHSYLPVSIFFSAGSITELPGSSKSIVWQIGDDKYINCVDSDIVVTIRTMLVLICVGIFFTQLQLILDLLAPRRRLLKVIQLNGTGSITTSLICITACGLAYWTVRLMKELQEHTKLRSTSHVTVAFGPGFYTLAAGCGLSMLATAVHCLRYPDHIRKLHRLTRMPVLSHVDDDSLLIPPPVDSFPSTEEPPPPYEDDELLLLEN